MPTFFRATFGSLEHVHAGIGDNHIQTSESSDRTFDEAFQILHIRHICLPVERAYAFRLYRLPESLYARIVRRFTRTTCHIRTRPCEFLSDTQPDPGGDSGDQDYLIFIIECKTHTDQI